MHAAPSIYQAGQRPVPRSFRPPPWLEQAILLQMEDAKHEASPTAAPLDPEPVLSPQMLPQVRMWSDWLRGACIVLLLNTPPPLPFFVHLYALPVGGTPHSWRSVWCATRP